MKLPRLSRCAIGWLGFDAHRRWIVRVMFLTGMSRSEMRSHTVTSLWNVLDAVMYTGNSLTVHY
jgi:hypothetical protein